MTIDDGFYLSNAKTKNGAEFYIQTSGVQHHPLIPHFANKFGEMLNLA
jgi:hypothetical protein